MYKVIVFMYNRYINTIYSVYGGNSMLKERQIDFLEEQGFKKNQNNEYECKFEDAEIQFLWSVPHQVGATYCEGKTELVYDFEQLVEIIDYVVGLENKL